MTRAGGGALGLTIRRCSCASAAAASHDPGELSDCPCGILGHEPGGDLTGIDRRIRARQLRRELAAEPIRAGEDALRRAHDGKCRKIGVAAKARPETGAQERRFAGTRGGLNGEDSGAAVAAEQTEFVEAVQDIGVAAEKDAGLVLGESTQARERLGIRLVLGRPRETVGRDAAPEQIILDLEKRAVVEADIVLRVAKIHLFSVGERRRRKVDDLPLLEGAQTLVLDGEIAQQHHDDLFAEVLGLADLGQTFGGGERIRRGEQKDGLAAQMRLAQGLLPDLAGANVLEVEEHVVFRPTVDAEPLLEGDGSDAVLAGMADEET